MNGFTVFQYTLSPMLVVAIVEYVDAEVLCEPSPSTFTT
jgi:hypothetical protein